MNLIVKCYQTSLFAKDEQKSHRFWP